VSIQLIDGDLTDLILGSAIEVHRNLGPGLLESTYETCLEFELRRRQMKVERQKALPVVYKGNRLDCDYRLDLLIEDRVIVELKAVETVLPLHEAQLLTYLKLAGLHVGLLLNFNVVLMKDGIHRFVR
jgi:GxxExxY protein